MTGGPVNIHATAIVVGTTGLLFTGPSGSGKSMTAFACLSAAWRAGIPATLLADDRVLLSRDGEQIIGECPATIAGLIEIRGSGIARLPHVASAPLHLAVKVGRRERMERLPPESERFSVDGIDMLPQLRLAAENADPLAVIGVFFPDFGLPAPYPR